MAAALRRAEEEFMEEGFKGSEEPTEPVPTGSQLG